MKRFLKVIVIEGNSSEVSYINVDSIVSISGPFEYIKCKGHRSEEVGCIITAGKDEYPVKEKYNKVVEALVSCGQAVIIEVSNDS